MQATSLVDLTVQKIFLKEDLCIKEIAAKVQVNYHSFCRFLRGEKPLPAFLLGPLYKALRRPEIVRAALVDTDLVTVRYPILEGGTDPMNQLADIMVDVAKLQRIAAKVLVREPLTPDEQAEVKNLTDDGAQNFIAFAHCVLQQKTEGK